MLGAGRVVLQATPLGGHQTRLARLQGALLPPRSSSNGVGPYKEVDESSWRNAGFTQYLANTDDDWCSSWEMELSELERRQSQSHRKPSAVTANNPVWRAMLKEAARDAREEPLLSSFLYAALLSHDTFERSLAFVLANRLSDPTLLATELMSIFYEVLKENEAIVQAALSDIIAYRERDPACDKYSSALLYYKGYHAVQVHRIAHQLWLRGQTIMARALQSRISEVFAVDIHPAAVLGKGILLDHATGVVIGETARVGNNVSIMQNVTLGGTGKETGVRHPQVHDNVLIGACATVLGNIAINKGAQVAAGSLVLKDVAPRTMVAGSPAKVVGTVEGNPAQGMNQWLRRVDKHGDMCDDWEAGLRESETAKRPPPPAAPAAGSVALGSTGPAVGADPQPAPVAAGSHGGALPKKPPEPARKQAPAPWQPPARLIPEAIPDIDYYI
ncbi:hypothetical protein WJX81_005338 [Elliptochloris bilobata]|uniref:serine O-acetyltransferase n=1 Tax=Elliptochloris bilobata TaxID=381761 RepID=A0AAW1SLM6_9CHLO